MYQADIYASKTYLKELLGRSTTEKGFAWLQQKMELVSSEPFQTKNLYLAFSAAPRFIGKQPLHPDAHDLELASVLREGFNPSRWTADQAARTLLLLSIPARDADKYHSTIETLFNTADMGEQVALYAALPLLRHPERFAQRAAEGIRTNMGDVFEAIALDNPYPTDYLPENAWNNMVLKTLFVGKPVSRIHGIEKRRNPKLARILSDYAHERWAAGRTVSPELWRPVGPFIDEAILQDIKKLFTQPNNLEQEAAALACYQSERPEARALLEAHPQLKARIENGDLTWRLIGDNTLQQG